MNGECGEEDAEQLIVSPSSAIRTCRDIVRAGVMRSHTVFWSCVIESISQVDSQGDFDTILGGVRCTRSNAQGG
jgi:hypothetical protein